MDVPYVNIHAHRLSESPMKEWVLTNIMVEDYPPDRVQGANYSVGFHPWNILHADVPFLLKKIQLSIEDSQLVAIGEAGLDKAIDTPLSLQMKVFEAQVDLAEAYGLPMILHIVKAHQELLHFCRTRKPELPMLIHGFRGSVELARDLVKEGLYLSIGASIKTSEKSRSVFRELPLEKLFLETDESAESIQGLYVEAARLKRMDISALKKELYAKTGELFQRMNY